MVSLTILFLISLATLMVSSAPVDIDDNQDTIVSYENQNDGSGNYKFRFQTAKGTTREETGTLIKEDNTAFLVIQGLYSYVDPEGNIVRVAYNADTNGYRITINPPILEKATYSLPAGVVASLLG